MTHRRLRALPALLLVTLALAGCVATPTPTPPASESPAVTPSPSASAEPTTEPSAAPAATCDTVLTADAYAKLANDGLESREPPAVDHMATYYPFAAQLIEAGGLSCSWGKPQTDLVLTVTQLADADSGAWAAALADAGFVESNDPVTGAYTGPVDPGTGISPVVVVAGDSMTFVSAPTFAGWIASTS